MSEQVCVPKKVYKTLCEIQVSGLTNMFNSQTVMDLAKKLGSPSTAEWIDKNHSKYFEGIFHGFIPEEGD